MKTDCMLVFTFYSPTDCKDKNSDRKLGIGCSKLAKFMSDALSSVEGISTKSWAKMNLALEFRLFVLSVRISIMQITIVTSLTVTTLAQPSVHSFS